MRLHQENKGTEITEKLFFGQLCTKYLYCADEKTTAQSYILELVLANLKKKKRL